MAKKTPEPSYEEALEKLENLIEAMEGGEVPLADLVARFEEGSKLLQLCQARLKEAELKIEKLKESRSEESAFSPFDPDAE
jgi:exodeoxyribonuclease VII small subunit